MPASHAVYTVEGSAGNLNVPDLPQLSFTLLVHATTGKISGHAEIVWFSGKAEISNVTGRVHKLHASSGALSQIVRLKGSYEEKGPPGTNFIALRKFSAHFATDAQWNGSGGFEYGGHEVEGVSVRHRVAQPPIVALYGVVIHDAQASGDLARMKEVAAQAERHIAATPDVTTALSALKAEIAALEA